PSTPPSYPLSLPDALPIYAEPDDSDHRRVPRDAAAPGTAGSGAVRVRRRRRHGDAGRRVDVVPSSRVPVRGKHLTWNDTHATARDRKSTRLNSSHGSISYS